MSWKNVKEHYGIGHIVQIREGQICIGSPYVSNLLSVSFDGVVEWGRLGPGQNEDLARYYAEMTADPVKLRKLIKAPDQFEISLPVFTYEGGDIIEKACEKYDWPNVTHDGELMHDNSFSPDRSKVVEWAKSNARSGMELADRRIEEIKKSLVEMEEYRAKSASNFAKLCDCQQLSAPIESCQLDSGSDVPVQNEGNSPLESAFPPKLRRDWIGKRVRLIREIRNGAQTITAGAVCVVLRMYRGAELRGPICKYCGVAIHITKVPWHDLEYIGECDDAQAQPVS